MKIFALSTAAVLLAAFGGVAQAANPASRTIAPGQSYTYTSGPFTSSNPTITNDATFTCGAATPCDDHTVTVQLPNDGKQYRLQVSTGWAQARPEAGEDYDILMYRENGAELTRSAGSANPEVYSQDVRSCVYTLRVVPFTVSPVGTATTTVSLAAVPNVASASNVCSAAEVVVAPPAIAATVPNPVGVEVPRYYVHGPSNAISGDTGEPSIGYNPFSMQTFMVSGLKFLFQTRPENLTPAQPASCDGTWVDRSHPFTSVTTLDPIGIADSLVRGKLGRGTGGAANTVRIWGGQLAGKAHITVYSENDGVSWTPTQGNAPVATGFDHQGIAAGPYPATGVGASIPHPLYPNAFYYCGQDIAYANCTRSDDGGVTFNPPQQMYQLTTCGGLHGHPRVAPDGTVYVPNPNCGNNAAVVVSENAGTTWSVRKIAGSTGSGWDPQIAIATDSSLMMCHADGLNAAFASFSKDKGVTWTAPKRLGAELGIEHVAFTQSMGGTPGRFTCAYLGTRTRGNPTAEDFTGVWHLYFSTTYDNGATWTTVNATPLDPVQGAGGVWDGGGGNINRNLLDFNEMTIDEKGYPIYGYSDGCIGVCDTDPTANSYTAHARYARQVGGRSLWADMDTANRGGQTYVPDRSCLAGTRDAQASNLSWKVPDNGGVDIAGYDIYRSTTAGTPVFLASTGPKPTYRDLAADPTVTNYFYTIKAKNSLGEGLFSNEVQLPVVAAVAETLCTVPGLTVNTDVLNDQSAAGSAISDISSLAISEPAVEDGFLRMSLKLRGAGQLVPGDVYAIRFSAPGDSAANQHWVGMVVGPSGGQTYVYGTASSESVAVAGYNLFNVDGNLPAGSTYTPAGVINLKVPHALFSLPRNFRITGFEVTVFTSGNEVVGAFTRRSNNTKDLMEGGVYRLRSATFCNVNTAPIPVLTPNVLSGKAPLSVTFDVSGSSDAEDSIVEYQFFENATAQAVVQSTDDPITITYTEPGRYGARLKVVDERGLVSESVAQVIIEVLEDVVDEGVTPFSFVERTNVPLSTFITSEVITVSGFTRALAISVDSGLQYSINGGPFTNTAGQINGGDRLAVRHVSSSAANTATEQFVRVGTFSALFRSVTTTIDHVPDAFGFLQQSNVMGGSVVESNTITLAAFDDAPVVAGPGVMYRLNGGSWTTRNGTMLKTDTLQVRHTANTASLGYTKSYVTVGGVRGFFVTRTKK